MEHRSKFSVLPVPARYTIMIFGAAGLVALLYSLAYQESFALGRMILFLSLAAVSARAKVKLYRGSTISFLTAVVLFAVVSEGPAVAVLLAVCGVVIQTVSPSRKVVLHQLAFNAGMIALTATATWWTHHLLLGMQSHDAIYAQMTATLISSFVYFLGNSLSVSLIVSLTNGISAFHIWSSHFLYSAPSFLIAGMLSLGVAVFATIHFLLIAVLLITVISIAYYCSIRLSGQLAR